MLISWEVYFIFLHYKDSELVAFKVSALCANFSKNERCDDVRVKNTAMNLAAYVLGITCKEKKVVWVRCVSLDRR